MKLTRRDFLTTSTVAAMLPSFAARRAHAQGTRTLYMDNKEIAILMIERAKGSGIPTASNRVDLMFVKHPDHEPPRLVIKGIKDTLNLDGADLRISVGGVPLKAGPVALHDPGGPITCPRNDEWRKLSSVPDIASVLQRGVALKRSCLDRANPALIGGRFMMPAGKLAASAPQNPYGGEQWTFPDGNSNYVRAFTDILNWDIPIGDGEVTFAAVPFGTNIVRQSISVPASPTSFLVRLDTPRLKGTEPPSKDRIVHFRHYYEYLDYDGGLAPIPVKAKAICPLATRTLTKEQLSREVEIRQLLQLVDKGAQQDEYEPSESGCDVGSEIVMRRRSADTFCPPLVVFEEV